MPTGPIKTFTRSLELNTKLHAMIPGGSHTYSKGEDQFPHLGPRVAERASGACCWDVEGNRYIDCAMGDRVIDPDARTGAAGGSFSDDRDLLEPSQWKAA